MRLLLDTHALLWWLADRSTLSSEARSSISEGDNEVVVSAASAWEIAIKRAAGKLRVPSGLEEALAENGFGSLPITITHAMAAGALPAHHRDPFDRMLVAQANLEGLTLVTRDPRFEPYGIPILRA